MDINVATFDKVDEVVECTNDAFMADAFFKKPKYHLRFTRDDVEKMINTPNSVFITLKDTNVSEKIIGSVYVQWSIFNNDDILEVKAKFSAASIRKQYERQGYGKKLIQAIEHYLEENVVSNHSAPSSSSSKKVKFILEMGVINLRTDLFPWYEKQGFSIIGEIRPNDEEVSRIILPELDVCCILMRKSWNINQQ